jgi:hypothetical protein
MLEGEGTNQFPDQALWGERGVFSVAACSNHVEGIRARINEAVG